MPNEPVLFDSDALVGWLTSTDAHHQETVRLMEHIKRHRMQPVVTNLVVGETATLLSYRQSQQVAREFLSLARTIKTIVLDEELHQATLSLFEQQNKKHTSYVDMANVVVMRSLRIPYLFAFDRIYSSDFDLPILTERHVKSIL